MGKKWRQLKTLFSRAQKSLQMVSVALKLKDLFLGRKAMTNLESILQSRNITLPTNVHLVKAMVFPVVVYGCVYVSESPSFVSDSLWPHGLYRSWNSPGQNTWVGNLSPLQGIFQTQGSNPGLWHCRQILYQLNHRGSPRILEWVAYPFSSESFQPRNQTGVSCLAGGFFTNWIMREAQNTSYGRLLYRLAIHICFNWFHSFQLQSMTFQLLLKFKIWRDRGDILLQPWTLSR